MKSEGIGLKSFKLLWNYMKGNRLLYGGAVLSIGVATLFSTMGPLVIRMTIDSIIGDAPLEVPYWMINAINGLGGVEGLKSKLWIPATVFVSCNMLSGIFFYLKGKWSAQTAEQIAKNVREKIYHHLQHLPYAYHVKAETGDLIQRCTLDVETIRRFLAMQLVEIGSALFMLFFVSYIMFSIHVPMTLVAMGVVPIIFAFAMIFFIKVRRAFTLADEAEAKLSTVLQENLTGIRVVKAFARQDYEIEKFEVCNRGYREKCNRLIRLLAWYWSLSDFLCMVQIGVLLIVGIRWTAQDIITLGTLVAFTTYEAMLLWPVRQMGRVITDLGKTLVAVERIQSILDVPIEEAIVDEMQGEVKGNISLKNVWFEYEEGNPILKDISFEVKAGQTIGILGPTGSGKSTLVHLLARLYDYTKGSITIDGIEIKTMDRHWLRNQVGIVLQEPFLFAKTIKENIGLAKEDFLEEEVIESAKKAVIHSDILDFDKGYDTLVGERGVSLSGGQKQRITIARALVKNYPIVVFDDSLSAVDTETDIMIRKAIKEKASQTTTFIISHRITTLSNADLIIVLDQGRIVQRGKHEELLEQPGVYKRIWDIQNRVEGDEKIKVAQNM